MSDPNLLTTVLKEFRSRMRKDLESDLESTPLADLGIDSLDFFETVMALEELLGFEIEVENLDANTTVRSFCDVIDASRPPV